MQVGGSGKHWCRAVVTKEGSLTFVDCDSKSELVVLRKGIAHSFLFAGVEKGTTKASNKLKGHNNKKNDNDNNNATIVIHFPSSTQQVEWKGEFTIDHKADMAIVVDNKGVTKMCDGRQ